MSHSDLKIPYPFDDNTKTDIPPTYERASLNHRDDFSYPPDSSQHHSYSQPYTNHADRDGNSQTEYGDEGGMRQRKGWNGAAGGSGGHRGDDDALAVLGDKDSADIVYSIEEDRRVLRKIDLWVLTPMVIVYTLQQMDKSSTSYSAVFNLQQQTNLVGTQYSWLGSIVYIAQLVFQPLSSYALVKFSVKYWLIFNLFSWGVCTACIGAAHNFTGLIIARFFLGVFEATVAPTFIVITQLWWRRREQSFRTIAWQVANSLAGIFGPLLAYGVGHIHTGGLQAYQNIFFFLGSVTVAFVPVIWWLMPHSPSSAKFLRHGNDRVIAIDRMRSNNTGTRSYTWRGDQAREAFRDPKSYGWAVLFLCTSTPSGGLGAFNGLITKGFGFNSFTAILFQMPIGAMHISVLLVSIWFINRIKMRYPVVAFLTIFPTGGAIALYIIPRDKISALLGAYYVTNLFAVLQPLLYSWATLNAGGHTKKVVTTTILFVAQCVGNIIGPQLFLSSEAPEYHTGLLVAMGCWATLCISTLTMGWYLTLLNKRKEKARVAAGIPANLADMSLMTIEEAASYLANLKATLAAEGKDVSHINEDAFEDVTDFANLYFQYAV